MHKTAIMDDSMEAILQVGNDLFTKAFNDSYKEEAQHNHNLIEKLTKDLKEVLQKKHEEQPNSKTSSKQC